jgi:hypothetical protein
LISCLLQACDAILVVAACEAFRSGGCPLLHGAFVKDVAAVAEHKGDVAACVVADV